MYVDQRDYCAHTRGVVAMNQEIVTGIDAIKHTERILRELDVKKFMLVCDASFPFLNVKEYFDQEIRTPFVKFDDFTPNPLYEDVCKGVKLFESEKCDALVAVGGGSSLDVAKCVKLYCKMNSSQNFLTQTPFDSKVPLLAVPTTAGTGSESTRYAVIYYNVKKQSITHDSILPNYALLSSGVLKTLPLYQKKCTALDALCQGIESFWSVNSTDESKEYSRQAIKLIVRWLDEYLTENTEESAAQIMLAANYGGRAINITQTTAAHAMSYKITSLYRLPHGNAVAVCLPEVWEYMNANLERCVDSRGSDFLSNVFSEIADALGQVDAFDAIRWFRESLTRLEIKYPVATNYEAELETLTRSVNLTRLKNNPVELSEDVLYALYCKILRQTT